MPITSLSQLFYYSNIETFSFGEKTIVLYDDHRTVLTVIFEALRMKMLSQTPNIIYFDWHDDGCEPDCNIDELWKKWKVDKIQDVDPRDFWSFVEFDLSHQDDDWLLAGMKLGLINDAVVVGAHKEYNISSMNGKYSSKKGIHKVYSIAHLDYEISSRGCLGDCLIKEPYYRDVRSIFGYNVSQCNDCFEPNTPPFVLDFDLDCFTTQCEEKTYAWPEMIFRQKYADNYKTQGFMIELIERAQIITICREAKCCGGLGESNKILYYLDKYFFEGKLGTEVIF